MKIGARKVSLVNLQSVLYITYTSNKPNKNINSFFILNYKPFLNYIYQ